MKSPTRFIAMLFLALSATLIGHADVPFIKVGKYAQEVGVSYTTAQGLPSNNVRAIYIGTKGEVFADTESGWAVFAKGAWKKCAAPADAALNNFVSPSEYVATLGLANEATRRADGGVVVASVNGLFTKTASGVKPLVVAL